MISSQYIEYWAPNPKPEPKPKLNSGPEPLKLQVVLMVPKWATKDRTSPPKEYLQFHQEVTRFHNSHEGCLNDSELMNKLSKVV